VGAWQEAGISDFSESTGCLLSHWCTFSAGVSNTCVVVGSQTYPEARAWPMDLALLGSVRARQLLCLEGAHHMTVICAFAYVCMCAQACPVRPSGLPNDHFEVMIITISLMKPQTFQRRLWRLHAYWCPHGLEAVYGLAAACSRERWSGN
jgi:hypothetical protein